MVHPMINVNGDNCHDFRDNSILSNANLFSYKIMDNVASQNVTNLVEAK